VSATRVDVPEPAHVRSVGIVVAAFNAAPFIAATLASIEAQTFAAWRCVVVDDGSSDDTAGSARAFAERDSRFELIVTTNGGHCRARNIGIGAHGSDVDAITVMDADDVWTADALEILVERIAARPDCIGAHGLGEFIDAKGVEIAGGEFAAYGRARRSGASGRLREWPIDADTSFETLVSASTVFPPGLVLMRRGVYDAIGGYDPRSVEGDWDLLLRATRLGPLAFIDRVIIGYRRHGENFGARREIPRLVYLTLVRAHESPLNSPQQRQTLRASWRAAQIEAMQRHRAALATAPSLSGRVVAALRLAVAGARYLRGRPRRPLRSQIRRAAGLRADSEP